ncbi:hypothetical protein D3C87_2005590 [compost metagenome]
MHHDAFHRRQTGRYMLGIGIGLQDILALDIDALERAIDGRIQHVGNAQARLIVERHAPELLEGLARRIIGNVAIAR